MDYKNISALWKSKHNIIDVTTVINVSPTPDQHVDTALDQLSTNLKQAINTLASVRTVLPTRRANSIVQKMRRHV